MTPRAKSALLLIGTLLIGIVLGVLLHARLSEQRIERLAFLRSQRGFVRFMERAIEPRDEEQRQAIRAVLERAAQRMAEHQTESRREARVILDSTRAELRALLTDEQLRQLEEHLEFRREYRPGRGRRGPPPPR